MGIRRCQRNSHQAEIGTAAAAELQSDSRVAGIQQDAFRNYTGDGVDVFAKLDVQSLEVFAYYYHATGLGTTAFFNLGAFNGETRGSEGYLAQATYKFGALKVGVQYGESKLDYANSADQTANPHLVSSNRKGTLGLYYSLTDNLTLLAEGSEVKSKAQSGGSNSATTVNVGAFFKF